MKIKIKTDHVNEKIIALGYILSICGAAMLGFAFAIIYFKIGCS